MGQATIAEIAHALTGNGERAEGKVGDGPALCGKFLALGNWCRIGLHLGLQGGRIPFQRHPGNAFPEFLTLIRYTAGPSAARVSELFSLSRKWPDGQ
jgi:hypothetical protein